MSETKLITEQELLDIVDKIMREYSPSYRSAAELMAIDLMEELD